MILVLICGAVALAIMALVAFVFVVPLLKGNRPAGRRSM